jgi:hypothetical protein
MFIVLQWKKPTLLKQFGRKKRKKEKKKCQHDVLGDWVRMSNV